MGLENPLHLAIIALIIVLLFGAKRLPELGRSLGSGLREFKGSLSGDDDKPAPTVLETSATQAEAPAGPPAAAPAAAAPPSGDSTPAA